jgi:hypothetical protein
VVAFDGDILRLLDIVNAFKDGQAMPNAGYTHGLEVIVEQSY